MSPPRLARALAASAAVHLGLVGGLLALAHPRLRAAPAMRVALVGQAGRTGASGVAPAERAPAAGAQATPEPVRPLPPRSTPHFARRTGVQVPPTEGAGAGATAEAEALVTAVQSDLWVLGAPREQDGAAGTGAASGAAGAAGQRRVTGQGASGADGASSASLLAALSQRLAWSAERCAPAAVVRTARHAIPGVPLHFCLDAAGRPSDVGLLGTTGSDQLDRAARDCVVPGALPLPPVPGCYTVEVRFPIRG